MLDFESVQITHKAVVESYFSRLPSEMCDFTFGNIFCWSIAEKTRVCEKNGFLYLRTRFNGVKSYAFPLGDGDIRTALTELEEDAAERRTELSFYCISEEQLEILKAVYGNRVKTVEQRDFFDYVYRSESLATLKGRKLHSKKNHVNSFGKKHDFSYEKITGENLDECLVFSHRWHKTGQRNPKLDEEMLVIEKAFSHFRELELSGVILRVNGEIVAYSMGEGMSVRNMYCTHFEKASPDFPQAYAVINKLTAGAVASQYEFINREDDAGVEGLRRAKTSYYPDRLVKKYYVRIV